MSEETLVRELERRADHVHPRHLGFEDVRRSAHRIQRRRRAAVVGGVAVAVAAVVLIPTSLLGGSPRSQAPDPAPPPPAGHTAVLHDGQVSLPDGTTVGIDLASRDVAQLGVLGDGRIVVAVQNSRTVRVYAADGTVESEHEVAINQITMSADDTLAAWIDDTYRVVVLESGVAEPTTFDWGIPMPGEGVGSIDAVYGSDCAHDGCTVLGGDFTTTTTMLGERSEPGTDLATSQPLRVSDVSPDGGRWAVSFPAGENEQYGCSGIYDVEPDQIQVRSCETSGLRFAPDGEHLLGMRGDNQMFGQVEVYDQGLQETFVYDPGKGVAVSGAAWDDDSHLLVVTATLDESPRWSLLRVPIDGSAPEVVEGPVAGPNPEISAAFRLAQ